MAVLVAILAMGIINLVRSDKDQATRSNMLMRMRVLMQFIAIIILVAVGFVSGAISF